MSFTTLSSCRVFVVDRGRTNVLYLLLNSVAHNHVSVVEQCHTHVVCQLLNIVARMSRVHY